MTDYQIVVIGGALTIVVGVVLLLIARRTPASRGQPAGAGGRYQDGGFSHVCTNCGDETLVGAESLQPLSSAEKALVVRECRAALGKDLREYVCRQCDASHCFAMTGGRAVFLGVNLYAGQLFGSRCAECRQPLTAPPWPPGHHDGALDSAPGLIDACGLACRFCGALTCVACCRESTRNRTRDGSLLCPRCFRGPNDQFYHP